MPIKRWGGAHVAKGLNGKGVNVTVIAGGQELMLVFMPRDGRDACGGGAFKLGPAFLLQVKHGQCAAVAAG
jgi:hypothetical protein